MKRDINDLVSSEGADRVRGALASLPVKRAGTRRGKRYGVVAADLWDGGAGCSGFPKVSAEARLVFMYLMSCERSNMIGLFRIKPVNIAADTGIEESKMDHIFEQLKTEDLVKYDHHNYWVWVKQQFRIQSHNVTSKMSPTDKRAISARDLLKHAADEGCPFVDDFRAEYGHWLSLPVEPKEATGAMEGQHKAPLL